MKSHELCVEFQASVELVCTNALCVLDFHVIKQLCMLLIANSTVLSIFAILGHVFTTRSGVMAWERDQQSAFLVVMMLPTLMPFLDSKYYVLNANE